MDAKGQFRAGHRAADLRHLPNSSVSRGGFSCKSLMGIHIGPKRYSSIGGLARRRVPKEPTTQQELRPWLDTDIAERAEKTATMLSRAVLRPGQAAEGYTAIVTGGAACV